MAIIKIAGAALNQTPLDWKNNLQNIKEAIDQAKKEKIDILCLPELCLTGYGCEDLFLHDWFIEKAFSHLLEIVEWCDNIVVSVGLPIKWKGNVYNSVCLIENKRIFGFSAKQFLAKRDVYYEDRWFTPWPSSTHDQILIQGKTHPIGDLSYTIKGIHILFEICEDGWRGENRPAAQHCKKLGKDIDLILNPSASHFYFGKTKIREKEVVVQASKEFNCTYLYVNLLGNESGRIIFDGEILIAQKGKLIQRNNRFSYKNVNLISSTIDFHSQKDISDVALNDDPQQKEIEFTEAVGLGLFDYLRKSKSRGYVLSLSGGADSSACAVLVAEMIKRSTTELGRFEALKKLNLSELADIIGEGEYTDEQLHKFITKSILHCAYQSTKNSSNKTFQAAKELAESIGATFYKWDVQQEVDSYTKKIEQAIGEKLSWQKEDIALQNIQARARSPIIWMLANIKNALLITTSNRSEGDVGYCTMDGDTSGSIAPIAGVDKEFIRKWLRWAEHELHYENLNYVNNLQPSAELRPLAQTQTDEDDLMPYTILLEIEQTALYQRLSPLQIFLTLKEKKLEENKLLKKHIIKFFKLWAQNQWKRERLAPAFHVDTFSIDPKSWCRFPILSGSFEEELAELERFENKI